MHGEFHKLRQRNYLAYKSKTTRNLRSLEFTIFKFFFLLLITIKTAPSDMIFLHVFSSDL